MIHPKLLMHGKVVTRKHEMPEIVDARWGSNLGNMKCLKLSMQGKGSNKENTYNFKPLTFLNSQKKNAPEISEEVRNPASWVLLLLQLQKQQRQRKTQYPEKEGVFFIEKILFVLFFFFLSSRIKQPNSSSSRISVCIWWMKKTLWSWFFVVGIAEATGRRRRRRSSTQSWYCVYSFHKEICFPDLLSSSSSSWVPESKQKAQKK